MVLPDTAKFQQSEACLVEQRSGSRSGKAKQALESSESAAENVKSIKSSSAREQWLVAVKLIYCHSPVDNVV